MAAKLIGGTTFHTGLGFKFGTDYVPLSDQMRQTLRKQLEDVELIIIDEISMVSSNKLYDVHRRLQEIFVSKELFGGKAMMLVGDIMQLPPVKGKAVFSQPKKPQRQSLYNSDQSLWTSFDVIVLKDNQRQGNNNPWVKCLNDVRIGEVTEEDLALLKSRQIQVPKKVSVLSTHIYYKNKDVKDYNKEMLNSLQSDLIEIKAIVSGPKGYEPFEHENTGLLDDTPFLKKLILKKKAKVMLVVNVSISDSLVNGVLGEVLDFRYDRSGKVRAVIVKFDDPLVGQNQIQQYPEDSAPYAAENGCPIYTSMLEYPIPYKKGYKSHGASCKITQIPLRLAWASTAHKVQGATFKRGSKVVVHGDKTLTPGMAYVMLSRVQDVNDVYLDDNFDFKTIKASKTALTACGELEERCKVSEYLSLQFDIFYVNTRSLKKHYPDIKKDTFAQRSGILCMSETWLNGEDCPPFFEKKTSVHAIYGPGKGCSMYWEELRQSKVLKKIESDTFQMIATEFDDKWILVLLYISSNANFKDIVFSLEPILSTSKLTILLGDFNFKPGEENQLSKLLTQKHDFCQLVTEPTHLGGNIIDHCYVQKGFTDKLEVSSQSTFYTDHSCLLVRSLGK